MSSSDEQIFKRNSKLHYAASKLFPKKTRTYVTRLYSFMRTIDDWVDQKKPDAKKLDEVERAYRKALDDPTFDTIVHQWDELETRVVKHIVQLQHRFKFEQEWVDSFFASMRMDVAGKTYRTLDDSLQYVHGAGEVVGQMMSRVLKLDKERELPDAPEKRDIKKNKLKFMKQAGAYAARKVTPKPRLTNVAEADIAAIDTAAKMAGRAMVWVYALRDIKEDTELGRCYFPQADLKKCGLKDLREETAKANPEAFKKFVNLQLTRYREWQAEAVKGMQYVPRRLRIPMQIAVDAQNWTARQIAKDPLIVYRSKVTPRLSRARRLLAKLKAR